MKKLSDDSSITKIPSKDENLRISFETFIRDRYFDYLPALRSMRRIYFTSIKDGGLIG